MDDYTQLAFNEDAVSDEDALGATERFFVEREGGGFCARLYPDLDEAGVNLVCRDRLVDLITARLDAGTEIRVGC
jgi:hypothetical protein